MFACSGFHADVLTLVKNLELKMKVVVTELLLDVNVIVWFVALYT